MGNTCYGVLFFRIRKEAVHKVEVSSRPQALKQGMIPTKFDPIPAHVGHLEARGEPTDLPRHNTQAGGIALFGGLEQQLQAKADSQKGPTGCYIFPNGSDQPMGF